MTFQQYISQQNPVKQYQVNIEKIDCNQIYNILPKGNKVIVLNIDNVLYSYLLTPESRVMYSMDCDGNKKSMSCFIFIN